MNKNEQDIVLTLSFLYEILLQIGQSFDVKENASSFLKTLMLQQNLSFAAYYVISDDNILKKVFSIPKTKLDRFSIHQETMQNLNKNSLNLIKNEDSGFDCFNALSEFSQSELAVSFAGTKSIIVLSKKNDLLDLQELNKYSLVFNKFSLFMESLESHHKIKDEIRIKNEQALLIQKNSLQLKEQNLELRKYINSNNELEKFAYRTSHDLKAPLRTLTSFSKILKKNSDSNLTEKQIQYLGFIEKGGIQMDNLIDGILAYSKINALELKKVEIDMNALLDKVQLLLDENISRISSSLKRKNIPQQIIGDEIKLTQLFLNLLNNALKFHREEVQSEITIAGHENDLEYKFSIHDNGIGMKKEDTNKIFEVFERLNSEDRYQGSGIGLSTCKQIVLQHEGRIWVESELGKGSTFYFTINKF